MLKKTERIKYKHYPLEMQFTFYKMFTVKIVSKSIINRHAQPHFFIEHHHQNHHRHTSCHQLDFLPKKLAAVF